MDLKIFKMELNSRFEKFEKSLHDLKHTVSEISLGHYACKREIKEINSEISLMGKATMTKGVPRGSNGQTKSDALYLSQGHCHDHRNQKPASDFDDRQKIARLEIKLDTIEQELKIKGTDFTAF